MNQLETLIAAREKIVRGWVKGNYAVNAMGTKVLENSDSAVAWCAIGAMHSTTAINYYPICYGDPLWRALPASWMSISNYNDHPKTTKRDILDLFDRAINIAEATAT